MTLSIADRDNLIRSAASWSPDYVVESAWLEHAPFAFWLTQNLRPRTFVELGTHRGYSYFCFCQAVQRLGLPTRCYAVDTWIGDDHAGFYSGDVFHEIAWRNVRYSRFSKLLRSTFDDSLDRFKNKSVDLLHIDGRHRYEDVKHDFESWRSKLCDDAIVLFHDTNVRERDFGVWKFFDELRQEFMSFEFNHGHGLGVIAPGQNPPALASLFAADDATIDDLRLIFSSLGAAVTQAWQLSLRQTTLEGGQENSDTLKQAGPGAVPVSGGD